MPEIEIHVKRHIDVGWSDWLGGLALTHTPDGHTILTGHLRDEAASYGLLSQLSRLGLHLISFSIISGDIFEPDITDPGSRDIVPVSRNEED